MKTIQTLKIFVVDDDQFMLNLIEHDLNERGFQHIETFLDGEDCINNLYQMPDVVILDYRMDNLNGLDVLKQIVSFNPDILVLFLTAQKQLQVAIDSLKYGAFDYIEKSNDAVDEIVSRINAGYELLTESRKGKFLKKIKNTFTF